MAFCSPPAIVLEVKYFPSMIIVGTPVAPAALNILNERDNLDFIENELKAASTSFLSSFPLRAIQLMSAFVSLCLNIFSLWIASNNFSCNLFTRPKDSKA